MFKIIKQFMAYRRQVAEDRIFYGRIARLISLELRPYTMEQCLIAAARVPNIRAIDVGPLANVLLMRCGRGKATLADAIALISK